MKNKLVKEIKTYYHCLFINDPEKIEVGNDNVYNDSILLYIQILDTNEIVGNIIDKNLPEWNVKQLREIIRTILYSDNISDVTKFFIRIPDGDVKRANEAMRNSGRKETYTTSINHISEDNDKLMYVLGDDLLKRLAFNLPMDKGNYENTYKKFINTFGDCRGLEKSLNLDITYDDKLNKENPDFLKYFLRDLQSYRMCEVLYLKHMQIDLMHTNRYINYLLSSEGAASNDKDIIKDREDVIKFFTGINFKELGYKFDDEVNNDNTDTTSENNDDTIDSDSTVDSDLSVSEVNNDNTDITSENNDDTVANDTDKCEEVKNNIKSILNMIDEGE